MGDPELRSDEKVILRTQAVFVKSIPFEGILTNKRIILIDRAKNLLPQKEIPLVTIKDIESGENAIRDQIITLSIVSKTGEMRQMILTFSRQAGGNRIRERDSWAKALKENISSSFEQIIRKVIPGHGQPAGKAERAGSAMKKSAAQEAKVLPSIKILENSRKPVPSLTTEKESDLPVSGFGTYCSRCGNRVPQGSGFCNRCGSQIVVPADKTRGSGTETVPQKPGQEPKPEATPPLNSDDRVPESRIYPDGGEDPQIPVSETASQRETSNGSEPSSPNRKTAPEQDTISSVTGEENRPEIPVTPSRRVSRPTPPAKVPHRPLFPRDFSIRPGSKAFYALVVAFFVIAAIAGGFFIYPLISKGGSGSPNTSISPTATTAASQSSNGIFTPVVTPVVTVPVEGVYVHIKYLGGWKGLYGIPSELVKMTSSGDRYYPVENATGSVEASFEKLDGSVKQTLSVEILKNGKILTSGNTTAGFGKVNLSVDTATGIAKPPQISTGTVSVTPSQTTQKTGT